jgi:hypothetical protein
VHLELGPLDGMTHKNTLDMCTIIIVNLVDDRIFKPVILLVPVDNNATERTVFECQVYRPLHTFH